MVNPNDFPIELLFADTKARYTVYAVFKSTGHQILVVIGDRDVENFIFA